MDFKELEYFSTIVKCGNLTHAARQLYVSQPTLSKFLQKLEEDLGLVLFQRGSRRLKLTYAGQRYYAHVERILSQKREMDAEMTDILRSLCWYPAVPMQLLAAEGTTHLPQRVSAGTVPHCRGPQCRT